MDDREIHISKNYDSRVNQLLRAAGYHESDLDYGREDLAAFIAEENLFYPENIAGEFIKWCAKNNAGHQGKAHVKAHEAIAHIVRTGFFNDAGVESYASTCTPMVLGLAEVVVQAAAKRDDTRFVLGAADICNLNGLNEKFPERKDTNPLLANFIHRPRKIAEKWAEEHGYQIKALIVRTGGDEFKYLYRFRTLDGKPIADTDTFNAQVKELNERIADDSFAYAHECGVDTIKHYKENRAPGVFNTVALRPLNSKSPAIIKTLEDLGGDISKLRAAMSRHAAQEASASDMLNLPTTMPASYHPLESENPYHDVALEPFADESLEHYSLRLALKKAGFDDFAATGDILKYNPKERWSTLDEYHPEFTALGLNDQRHIKSVVEAEHIRGIIDPASGSYSPAFYPQCDALATWQNRSLKIRVHLKNLGGMNLLGDALGDAVLLEVGSIIDRAYQAAIGGKHKPPVVRYSGGEFIVYVNAEDVKSGTTREFAKIVREAIDTLNKTKIGVFAEKHDIGKALSSSAQNGYTIIGDISSLRNDAFGTNHGLEIEFGEVTHGKIQQQGKGWETFIRSASTASRSDDIRR